MDYSQINFPKVLFVSGIDTDAGKSYATGWLAALMMNLGKRVITQKFIQTGNIEFSEDIQVHRKIMNIPLATVDLLKVTAPVIFTYPASPDLAARIDGTIVDLNVIDEATETLASEYDNVIVEGAGGVMVPVNGEYLTIDYVRERKLPLVLVTNGRLGSINHTLLSLNAIADAGIDLFAVVYNTYFDKDKVICEDTKEYIKNWLAGHFPHTLYLEF